MFVDVLCFFSDVVVVVVVVVVVAWPSSSLQKSPGALSCPSYFYMTVIVLTSCTQIHDGISPFISCHIEQKLENNVESTLHKKGHKICQESQEQAE